MNIHELQPDEARYLLFSIRKTLDERDILPSTQVQFYDSLSRSLRKKLERIDRASEGYPEPPERDRFAKVRTTWDPESLDALSRDLEGDNGKVRKD
jgi:hypothetical protein